MTDNEYIKLNRKIIGWEWFTDSNTAHLFVYCLLKANWKDGKFQGKDIKRGSFVTSLEKMKVECGLSIQQVRTALNKLQSTGEITNNSYTKYRVITVNNYELYQNTNKQDNRQDNKQVSNNQQTNNKQITTIEEVKNIRTKELKKKDLINNSNELFNCPSESQPDEKTGAYDDLLKLWNSLDQYGIKPIRAITSQRLRLLKPRIRQYGRESFAECVEQIKQSDFLQGKHTGKPWTVTFDWMILPSNYPKVLEGNYRNKSNGSGGNQNQYLQDIMQMIGE